MSPLPRIALAALPLALALAGSAAAQISFVENGPFSLPGSASVLHAVDVNNDGNLDLVSAHFASTQLRISLGDGAGGFVLQPAGVDIGIETGSISTGDVDADGLIDLAATSLGTPAVVVQRNVGGTFVPHQVLDPGALPGSCVFADFTGDGRADLAVAKGAASPLVPPAVRVYLADGAGVLAPGPADIEVAHNPIHIVAAHFDAGAQIDLAVASAGEFFGPDGSISLILATGSGTFAPAVQFGSVHPVQLSPADLDGNGTQDLATIVATAGFGCGFEGQLYSNGGMGAFSTGQTIDFGCGPFAVLAADFDQDGANDLLLTDGGDLIPAANFFQVAVRDAGGTFIVGVDTWPGLFSLATPALGDFDGDGDPDVAFAGYSTGLHVFRNTSAGAPVQEFVRGDTNDDSIVDIADVINLLAALFVAGTPPLPCPDAGDGNDDGAVNIADAISVLSGLFSGGPPPPAPFPFCGPDPTADSLPACAYPC